MLGGRACAAGDFDVHVVELIRDLGAATGEVVVEANQEVWPIIGMIVGHRVTPGRVRENGILDTTRGKNPRARDHSPIGAFFNRGTSPSCPKNRISLLRNARLPAVSRVKGGSYRRSGANEHAGRLDGVA